MRPMSIKDVRAFTNRDMTYEEAVKLANPGDPFLHNMALALSMLTRLNTHDDWLRLQAALVILRHKRLAKRSRHAPSAYQP